MSYLRFAAMIATSTAVMYALMYLNTYALEHVLWSETRAWMALLMGASMAVIMLGFMLRMYERQSLNLAIFAGAVAVFAGSLWLVRSQATVDEVDYMKAMIPHHSIAIMTSERFQVRDPRVRKLADEIIAAQEREIAEMKHLIAESEAPGAARARADEAARVVPASQALSHAHVPTLDPARLERVEIERALGAGPRCEFRYASYSEPVVAVERTAAEDARGVVKLNGDLVILDAASAEGRTVLGAERIRITLAPLGAEENGEQRRADMVFEVGDDLRAGYRGDYRCVE